MMKKKPFSSFQLHRLHLYPPLVQLVTFVVIHIYSPPPCQIISPLHPPRLHRLHLCLPFVQLVKFVVFQIHSPPSEGSGEVPSTPSPAPFSSLSTIRDIREIRSLTSTIPSALSNNQSPPPLRLHRLPLCSPFVTFEKFVVFQIHSPPSEGSGEVPPYRVYRLYMCSPFVQLVKFVVL